MKNKKRILWQIFGLGGVLALAIVLVVTLVDVAAVWREVRQANPYLILAASLFLVAGLLVFAVRWRFLLQNRPGLAHTFHASNIGHAGNILIPGRVGEPLRILVMGQDDAVSYTDSVSSFVVERLFEQLMRLLALVAAIALGSGIEVTPLNIGIGIFIIAALFLLILLLVKNRDRTIEKGTAVLSRLPRVTAATARQWLTDLLHNLQYIANANKMSQAFGLSLLSWICFFIFFYLTLLSLAEPLSLPDSLAIAMGALALSPPSAATQPGLFHASIAVPLAAVGFDEVILVAYAIILHVIEMFWIILLAVWGLARTGISLSAVINRQLPEKNA